MISTARIIPTIPVTEINQSREFYEKVLGLHVVKEAYDGVIFQAGEHTKLYLYQREPSKADHTLASFEVTDIEETVDELYQKGIVFEQYDTPIIKTNEKGIADMGGGKVRTAWFKDPDGNILAISQMM